MATRVQAQYAPRGTGLERVAARPVATVQAQFNTPQESSGSRLARALGVLDAGPITGSLQRIQDVEDAEEQRRAQAYANSITLEELGKQIREGRLLPSQSPVFAATLQNIYGENSQKALERDIASKMSSGELRFTNEQELDEYLTSARNEYLTGQSAYTIAGFDRGWGAFRSNIAQANARINDASAVARGVAEAADNLGNVLLDVTSPTFQGTDEDRVRTLMGRYELLTSTSLLRDDARKEALGGLATRIAASGNTALLQSLFNQKTPNNGPTVGGVLGDQTVASLTRTSQVAADRALQDAAREANIRAAEAILAQANFQASLLASTMRGHEMPNVTVPTPTGGTREVKGSDLMAQAVAAEIATNPNMPIAEQVRRYANNGVVNSAWKGQIVGAAGSLADVAVDAHGKPVGELLPQTLEALDLFGQINQVNPSYAQEMAGGERSYQRLLNVQALREVGINPNLAAALVDQSDRNTYKNSDNINAQVRAATNKVMDPSIFTSRFWGEVFAGEWGEGTKNIRSMEGNISSLAKAYMAAGIAATGDDAVRMAMEYYANPAVSTQINNAVYLNKDLPRVPDGQDQRFWVQRFIDERVKADIESQDIEFNADDIYLHPMRGGEGRFMLHLNGQPLGITYLRRDIESWINTQNERDITERITSRAAQPREGSFTRSETDGGAAIIYRNPR